jgi:hypothetical protein
MVVTNNNGVWIGLLDLLTPSLQSLIITITHNKCLPRTRTMLTGLQLTSDLRLTWFRVRITLRLAVYRQSIRLGDKPFETHDQ